jgi:ribosomal protein S18 acetylase RimI-like enzyme
MNKKYVFTLATQDDAFSILNFYHSLIGTPGCTWSMEYPDQETVNDDIINKSLYVLKEDNEIIAVAFAGVSDELRALKWSSENPCDLARIGVLSSRQNKGIGSLMLDKVIYTAKERGFDGIRMLVSKSNPSALALYTKKGFTACGETYMYEHDFYCYEMVFNG